MSWPLASHFSAMLQNPRVAFRDAELREYRVEKDAMNQPRPWAGAFAVVYKGLAPAGKPPRALRVFTTESPERRERYDLINEYLRQRRLKCLVEFEYRDGSIRATDGKWYPLIVMEWVEGSTLFHWARDRALAGDARELEKAARHWVAVVRELEDNQLAHGDLQHANVMITPQGEVKLVDYDGMCVPALIGRRNLEVGVEPYQHPSRNADTQLALDLDRFSALVIYVALRALAAEPGLWRKYVDEPGHDKLLFRVEDFRAPDSSPLMHDLRHGPDQELRELVDQLLESVRAPMNQVPSLSVLTDSYSRLEQLLAQRQWSEAVKWLNKRGRFRDAPEHLQTLIHEAYEHVCRSEAWEALDRIPRQESEIADRQLAVAWNEPLFADFPPAELERPRVEQARRRTRIIDQLVEVILTDQAAVSLERERKIAWLVGQLPIGYKHSYETRVQLAQRRVAAVAEFEAAALRDPIDEALLAQAWQTLADGGFAQLVEDAWKPRAQLAAQRAHLLKGLAELPERLPPDQLDRRVLALWKDELLADCAQAAAWRPLYNTALRRRELLRELQTALEAGQSSAILAAIEAPELADYPLPGAWQAVIRGVREKAAKVGQLVDVLRQGRPGELLPLFDAAMIREYAPQFAAHQKTLIEWTQSQVLPLANLGLGPAIGRASLYPAAGQAAFRVRWNWPPARFSQECLLTISAHEPTPGADPALMACVYQERVTRSDWEHAGGCQLVPVLPDWQSYYVAAWAIIDLGFLRLASHPLVLGTLDLRGMLFQRRRPGAAAPPVQCNP